MALMHLDEAKIALWNSFRKIKPRKIPKLWIYCNFNVEL